MRCEKEVGALGFCSAPSRVKGFTVFFFFWEISLTTRQIRNITKLPSSVLKSKRTLTPLASVLSPLSVCSLFTPETVCQAQASQTQQMTNKTIKHRSTQTNNHPTSNLKHTQIKNI